MKKPSNWYEMTYDEKHAWQRQADEFQGDDLFQRPKILDAVDSIPGLRSARLEQPKAVVVM